VSKVWYFNHASSIACRFLDSVFVDTKMEELGSLFKEHLTKYIMASSNEQQ
jgi:hypothetical protein